MPDLFIEHGVLLEKDNGIRYGIVSVTGAKNSQHPLLMTLLKQNPRDSYCTTYEGVKLL